MKRSLNNWVAIVLGVMLPLCALSQTPTAATASPDLSGFRQEQLALKQELSALLAQGASFQQVQAWMLQNSARFAAQQDRAKQIGSVSAQVPLPIISGVALPDGASQELSDFVATNTEFLNTVAATYNQSLSSPGAPSTSSSITSQPPSAQVQLQRQRATDLAAVSAQTPLPVPGPTTFPLGASVSLQNYLTARDQVLRARAALYNQYLGASTADRAEALQAWDIAHASEIKRLQILAQAVSNL